MTRPRGRLFWKFFLSILLAQVAAASGVGTVFWLREQARLANAPAVIETGPPAAFMLDAAAVALKYGGLAGLRDTLAEPRRHNVYIVDDAGRELLGRSVTPAMRDEARRELGADRPYRPVRMLKAPDGSALLAFVPRRFRDAGGESITAARLAGGGEALRGRGGRGPHGPGWYLARPVPLVASVVVSLLFAFLLAWYFSRPIRALRAAFDAAAAGDLAPRFGARPGGDELDDLGRDFDRMSGRLRALMEGQRRLLHDVSHELRAPLARLQAAIGLAHQQPERVASSLDRIERESVRMDRLVGELLTLSRLDASHEAARMEPIDLSELADGVAGDARFEAGPGGPAIALRFDGEEPPCVRGDPDLLWRAIDNVVRNAVKHGGAGGIVEMVIGGDAHSVSLDVLDRGPGVPDADLAAIFEPFVRAGASADVDGHGLGLAIARRVVQAMKGTINADNRAEGGLRVRIELPRAACH